MVIYSQTWGKYDNTFTDMGNTFTQTWEKHGNTFTLSSYHCACRDIMMKWNGIQRATLGIILNQMEGMCMHLLESSPYLPSHLVSAADET